MDKVKPDSDFLTIDSIKIKIGNVDMVLSLEQLKSLRDILNDMFGQKTVQEDIFQKLRDLDIMILT